jgi:hypothetical protein
MLLKFLRRKGPDTAALAFRVGLHSGPVTGGVLRGDNARFQLFGDVSARCILLCLDCEIDREKLIRLFLH